MKIEIELSKKEAQEIIGNAIRATLGTIADGLELDNIDWTSYGQRVSITLTPPEPITAAPESAAA